ncbi:MAG: ferrous iron transport protein A [Planctomycetes bacterium]|nr:ferrous iron transport protein A [Planctomycetota bacterium]
MPSLLASSLRRGEAAVVDSVLGGDALAARLDACGLWPGAPIELLAAAPFGDPLLFSVHGYRLALRRSEAERVCVRVAEPQA